MKTFNHSQFNTYYQQHCKMLELRGLQPKTVDAYTRALRRIGEHFDYELDNLSHNQLLDYFHQLLQRLSWSTVKLDLYGLKFFYTYILNKSWDNIPLIKPPKATRLPDIVTAEEAQLIFSSTRKLSYRVLFFTLYSLGLRLGEGIQLRVSDIDAGRERVHIRNAKGNKDRFVPLPQSTLSVLRAFWLIHKHDEFIFPNRKRGLKGAQQATTPLDRGGVQTAIRQVVSELGIKKKYPATHYAIAMRPIF